MAGIGRSTDKSTATLRIDLPVDNQPASVRYNNPGAQYPSERAARFGQLGYGIIGGGHKIARFPDPVNGAAANFDLLFRNYAGMKMGPAGKKWTGSYGFGIPGYPDDTILTKEMLNDPKLAIAIMKAVAGREAGKKNTLAEEQWKQAHDMFKAGSATAYLDGTPPEHEQSGAATAGPTGAGLLRRARQHIGERYVNRLVPKDDPNWAGPWDCAEFVSWLVYQEAKTLYGCVDDKAKPSQADAYTGAWQDDSKEKGIRVSVKRAASTVGGILLRYPPSAGAMGHIVLCDGEGGTVEAMGTKYGVVASTVHGRRWDTGILVPGISYDDDDGVDPRPPAEIYRRGEPNMDPVVIRRIQEALVSKGLLDSREVDGELERSTEDAVIALQRSVGLVVDGEVGPDTADALGISLKPGDGGGSSKDTSQKDTGQTKPLRTDDPLVGIAISLLPSIAKFLIGDKAGAVTDIVKKLVTETAGTSNPDQAQRVLQDDQAARTTLQLKLAEIEKEQTAEREQRQLELIKEQNAAEAEKGRKELEKLRVQIEDTKDARTKVSTLATTPGADKWIVRAPPIVSYIVAAGFFAVLGILIFYGVKKDGDSVIQLVNIVIGALTAAFATVVNFWLGSSQGSKDKDRQIQETSTMAIEAQTRAIGTQAKKADSMKGIKKPSTAIDRCVEIVLGYEKDDNLKYKGSDEERENYRTKYWNVLRCGDLPAGVDLIVLDFAVVADVTAAAKALQKSIGAKEDGSVGDATIATIQTKTPLEIVEKVCELRVKYHRDRGDLSDDLMKRIAAVKDAAKQMIAGTAQLRQPLGV